LRLVPRAVLLVIITVAALQVAVTLMRPNTSNLVYAAVSGREAQTTSSAPTSGVITENQTLVVTQGTTQTLMVTPPAQTVTSVVTLTPQVAAPDYTPIGIAVVVAVGILALFAMFMKRKR